MKKVILLFLISLGIQSCSKKLDITTLTNTKWILSEWPGRTIPASASATLNFGTENTINGKSFCNGFGGKSTVTQDSVKFEELIGTKMYCEAVGEAENNYLADLQSINAIQMNGEKLALLKDGVVIMAFVRSK